MSERCVSFRRSGGIVHYCDLPAGHDGAHINVKPNGTLGWPNGQVPAAAVQSPEGDGHA